MSKCMNPRVRKKNSPPPVLPSCGYYVQRVLPPLLFCFLCEVEGLKGSEAKREMYFFMVVIIQVVALPTLQMCLHGYGAMRRRTPLDVCVCVVIPLFSWLEDHRPIAEESNIKRFKDRRRN